MRVVILWSSCEGGHHFLKTLQQGVTRESAFQPYADGYHRSVHLQTSANELFNNTHLHMVGMQTAQLCILNAVAQ